MQDEDFDWARKLIEDMKRTGIPDSIDRNRPMLDAIPPDHLRRIADHNAASDASLRRALGPAAWEQWLKVREVVDRYGTGQSHEGDDPDDEEDA